MTCTRISILLPFHASPLPSHFGPRPPPSRWEREEGGGGSGSAGTFDSQAWVLLLSSRASSGSSFSSSSFSSSLSPSVPPPPPAPWNLDRPHHPLPHPSSLLLDPPSPFRVSFLPSFPSSQEGGVGEGRTRRIDVRGEGILSPPPSPPSSRSWRSEKEGPYSRA